MLEWQGARRIGIITRREYLQRVRTRSFISSTILLPLIFASLAWLPAIVSEQIAAELGAGPHKTMRLAIVASETGLAAAVEAELKRRDPGAFTATLENNPSAQLRADLDRKIRARTLDGYLWLESGGSGVRSAIFARRASAGVAAARQLEAAVWFASTERKLAPLGIGLDEARRLIAPISFTTADVIAPSTLPIGEVALAMVAVLTMLMFVSLLSYGVMVMRAVLDEKSSRITEVLMCSTSAGELMTGKVLGIGAIGLTQVTVWFSIAAVVVAANPATHAAASSFNAGAGAIAWFIVFYLLGYLLYSSIHAAVGASFNSTDEAQQWTFMIMLPLLATTLMIEPALIAPNSALVVAGSIFPLSAPVLMYARLLVARPPIWQIGLSLIVLIATVWAALSISARIYRVGVLMYGKRPTLREVVRWLRYA